MTLVLSGIQGCPCFYATNACNTISGMNGSFSLTGNVTSGWTGYFSGQMTADYWGEEVPYGPCGSEGCGGDDSGSNPLDLAITATCTGGVLIINAYYPGDGEENYPVFSANFTITNGASALNGLISTNCSDPLGGGAPLAYLGAGVLSW